MRERVTLHGIWRVDPSLGQCMGLLESANLGSTTKRITNKADNPRQLAPGRVLRPDDGRQLVNGSHDNIPFKGCEGLPPRLRVCNDATTTYTGCSYGCFCCLDHSCRRPSHRHYRDPDSSKWSLCPLVVQLIDAGSESPLNLPWPLARQYARCCLLATAPCHSAEGPCTVALGSSTSLPP